MQSAKLGFDSGSRRVCRSIFRAFCESTRHVHNTLAIDSQERCVTGECHQFGNVAPKISLHFCLADHSCFGSATSWAYGIQGDVVAPLGFVLKEPLSVHVLPTSGCLPILLLRILVRHPLEEVP